MSSANVWVWNSLEYCLSGEHLVWYIIIIIILLLLLLLLLLLYYYLFCIVYLRSMLDSTPLWLQPLPLANKDWLCKIMKRSYFLEQLSSLTVPISLSIINFCLLKTELISCQYVTKLMGYCSVPICGSLKF